MQTTATATDPLGLSDSDVATVPAGGATGVRTVTRSLLENRVNWGSAVDASIQGPTLGAALDFQSPAGPVTLGVTFTLNRACSLVAVRIYKHPSLSGTIPLGVWNAGGTLLATTSVAWASDTGGWRTITLPSPVSMVVGDYTVGYLAPNDNYAYSPWVWNAQDTSVPPFFIRGMVETAAGRQYGSGHKTGASLTWPTAASADRGPANYYIDPIVSWTDTMPGYTGGLGYYDQWETAGSRFDFPLAVFFADPGTLAGYKAIGINTLIAGDASDEYIAAVKGADIDWYPTLHGGDMRAPVNVQYDTALAPKVRGYYITDEPDLITPYHAPATVRAWRNACRAIDSTRPTMLGLSYNPVKNQGFTAQPPGATVGAWNQSWRDYAALTDVLQCDFYSLAASDSFGSDFPGATNRYGTWAYPPQIRRMIELNDGRTPVWGVVETTSELPDAPTPDQVLRAVWALLIAGARGIVCFDHRFADADVSQDFSAMLSDPAMAAMITGLSSDLQALAGALYSADADLITGYTSTGTMAEAQGGYAAGANIPLHYTSRLADGSSYLFVQAIRDGETTATVSVPSLAGATLTVIGEARTVTVNGSGNFTDDFDDGDYTFHLYATTADPTITAPVNTAAPVVTSDGTPAVGEVVSCSSGTWSGLPIPTYSRQWQRDGSNISGGTGTSYTLQAGDEGAAVRCVVTATNAAGSASANSNTITPAAAAPAPTLYRDAVLALSGLIGFWGVEDLTDDGPNGLDLTSAGAPTSQSSLVPSEPGANKAKGFNDGSDALSRANTSVLNPSLLSFALWVKPTVIDSLVILSKGANRIDITAAGLLRGSFDVNGTVVQPQSTTSLASGTTYHIVGTYDGTHARIYIDGVEAASVLWPLSGTGTIASNTSPFVIGNRSGDIGWVGVIDDVAYYDRALTQAEIAGLYDAGTSTGGALGSLSRVPWEGGSNYYTTAQEGAKMTNAQASGWNDPAFFPIAVYLANPALAADYQAIGVNTYMGVEHNAPVSDLTDLGMFAMLQISFETTDGRQQNEWIPSEATGDQGVVAWFIYDEAEQGEGLFWNVDEAYSGSGDYPPSSDARRLEFFEDLCTTTRALADGRFLFNNFGNGVLRDFAAIGTMDGFVQAVDGACIDKYAYTSGNVADQVRLSPDWPSPSITGNRAAAYGWYVDQMQDRFDDPANRRPQWVFVETKKPLLGESTATIITHAQMAGAIWAAITHEARGIAYFDRNGFYPPNVPATDPNTGAAPTTSDNAPLVDGPASYGAAAAAINARVTALAPVLNTQSYVWDFGATGVDTMLKAPGDGFAYIFAVIGVTGTTGAKTFSLPPEVTGTSVEVVEGTGGPLAVTGGDFSYTFANEYSVLVGKVAI